MIAPARNWLIFACADCADATDALPEEFRAARWLLKEREQMRAKAQREAE